VIVNRFLLNIKKLKRQVNRPQFGIIKATAKSLHYASLWQQLYACLIISYMFSHPTSGFTFYLTIVKAIAARLIPPGDLALSDIARRDTDDEKYEYCGGGAGKLPVTQPCSAGARSLKAADVLVVRDRE